MSVRATHPDDLVLARDEVDILILAAWVDLLIEHHLHTARYCSFHSTKLMLLLLLMLALFQLLFFVRGQGGVTRISLPMLRCIWLRIIILVIVVSLGHLLVLVGDRGDTRNELVPFGLLAHPSLHLICHVLLMMLIVEPRRARLEVRVELLCFAIDALGFGTSHLLHLVDVTRVCGLVVPGARVFNGVRVKDDARADSLTER